MHDAEEHQMELLHADEAGTEEWFCPTCGRHFVMRWPPEYEKTVLAAGDEYAVHLGGRGGLKMDVPAVHAAEPLAEPSDPLGDELLAPWRAALDAIDPATE